MRAKLARKRAVVSLFFLVLAAVIVPAASGAESQPPGDRAVVVPVDWSRFGKPVALNQEYQDCLKVLQNCAKFNLAWIDKSFAEDKAARAYTLVRFDEHGVRPACSVVYGMAVLLKCDGLDANVVGLSRQDALDRTVKLLRGAASAHKTNCGGRKGWGDHWQSALWSALLGCGGWQLWDELDPAARQSLVNVVVHEADRMSRHEVPYWHNGVRELSPGDTKAEENAWNSMILNVAAAMMPGHPHAHAWKLKSSELMVSAYATEADWRSNATVLDGRTVKAWLRGYNALPNGVVVNHGFLHPDYMSDEKLNLWAYLTQSLAGRPVPQTAQHNGPLIYRTFVTHRWPSPPYRAPGGTIYRENQSDVYYPKGCDWSTCDVSNFYLNDVWAHVLGWDRDLPQKAAHWMRLRAARMLQMQQRHPDRRMFAPKEYDTYPGAEQMMAWLLADGLLALRLDAYGLMGKPADWLAPSPVVARSPTVVVARSPDRATEETFGRQSGPVRRPGHNEGPGHNKAPSELPPLLSIQWRLGPDYPMGIQDSAVGIVRGKLVSAGGFTRHPLHIVRRYPDAFGGQPSGFTKLAFAFDPKNEAAGWRRIADMPGPARQGAAVAVVDDALYAMGGINYTEPLCYRETYRLREDGGKWTWEELKSCRLPWPVYGAANSTAVLGKRIYLVGAADYFRGPGADGPDFHSEAGRDGSPVGRATLVLDTANLGAGWKRLSDCPGVPKFDTALAAVGGKLYQLGGVFAPLAKSDTPYCNAVDSWSYDPSADRWTRLADMPHGSNRRALVYANRWIVLLSGFKYGKTRTVDGALRDVYNADEKVRPFNDFFERTVLIYDTQTGRLGPADPLPERTCYPSAAAMGDTLYALGGEGGPRLYHPATLQIGKVIATAMR